MHEAISLYRQWYLDSIDNVLQCLQCIIVRSPYTSGNSSSIQTRTHTRTCTRRSFPSTYLYLRSESLSISLGLLGFNQFEKERTKGWLVKNWWNILYWIFVYIGSGTKLTSRRDISRKRTLRKHRVINFPISKIVISFRELKLTCKNCMSCFF